MTSYLLAVPKPLYKKLKKAAKANNSEWEHVALDILDETMSVDTRKRVAGFIPVLWETVRP